MDKKRILKLVINILLIGLIVTMILPGGRTWVQQGLMKLGVFKPKLETPKEAVVASGDDSALPSYQGISFSDDQGDIVHISDLQGKVVFLNFWATWCPPCKAEMPSIQVLKDKFKDNDQVAFLIVEIEGEKDKARDFMLQGNMDLPVFYPESQIPSEWVSGAIPTTVILDKTGKMATKHEGMADYSRSEVSDFITELIQQ